MRYKIIAPDRDEPNELDQRLITAIINNDSKQVQALFSRGVDLKAEHGRALLLACEYNRVEIIQLLIQWEVHLINGQETENGVLLLGQALGRATVNGQTQIVKTLLRASNNLATQLGGPLSMASRSSQRDILQSLLITAQSQKISNPEYASVIQTQMDLALIEAVDADQPSLDAIDLLLDRGADPNQTPEPREQNALSKALLVGNAYMVKCLLDYGARVDLIEPQIANKACDKGNLEVIRMILDRDYPLTHLSETNQKYFRLIEND